MPNDWKPPMYQASVDHWMPPETWTLTLSRYQRDNLLFLINACGYNHEPVEPFHLINNGDWIGELTWMLGKKDANAIGPGVHKSYVIDEDDHPNTTFDKLRADVARWQGRETEATDGTS